jgi:hypothetical protein
MPTTTRGPAWLASSITSPRRPPCRTCPAWWWRRCCRPTATRNSPNLLERDAEDEQAGIASLLTRAAGAGQIDATLDRQHTASWITTLVGALYLRAALDDGFDRAVEMPTLRLILWRFLRPGSR